MPQPPWKHLRHPGPGISCGGIGSTSRTTLGRRAGRFPENDRSCRASPEEPVGRSGTSAVGTHAKVRLVGNTESTEVQGPAPGFRGDQEDVRPVRARHVCNRYTPQSLPPLPGLRTRSLTDGGDAAMHVRAHHRTDRVPRPRWPSLYRQPPGKLEAVSAPSRPGRPVLRAFRAPTSPGPAGT
jgi:hypothetical protein